MNPTICVHDGHWNGLDDAVDGVSDEGLSSDQDGTANQNDDSHFGVKPDKTQRRQK